MPYTLDLGGNVVLVTQTLKKIQHLLGEDNGPSSPRNKVKYNSRKNFKIPQSTASSLFFFHHKARIFNTEIKVSMILISNTVHPENEKWLSCEINGRAPKLLFPTLYSTQAENKTCYST